MIMRNGAYNLAAIAVLTLLNVLGLMGPAEYVVAQPEIKGSVLRIKEAGPYPLNRHITVGLNKSLVVELPREVRDVLVSNPKMLDAVVHTSRRAYLIGMATGQANVFFFGKDGEQILTLEVTVERDLNALASLLHRFLPGADIKAEMVNDNIILTGSVRNPTDATRATDIAGRFVEDKKKVLNMLAVTAREQILLKVTVAEINREMIKRLGVNWNGARISNSIAIGGNTNNGFPITNQLGSNSSIFGVFGPNQSSCTVPSIARGAITPSTTLPAAAINCLAQTVEAFERNGLARTLAEPTLTAISGETASFLAGGEFPIPVGVDDNTIAVEWKPFGVGLSFTPVVMSEERISLKISTEVSELSTEGAVTVTSIALPALKVRRTNTTVELPSGGGIAIAGLISDETKQNIDGMPGLKRLPILGALFRSSDYRKRETELVVIVTPYTVKPVARKKLIRPDDGYAPPSDKERLLLGRLNRVYGRRPEDMPVGSYKGEYGFIID